MGNNDAICPRSPQAEDNESKVCTYSEMRYCSDAYALYTLPHSHIILQVPDRV